MEVDPAAAVVDPSLDLLKMLDEDDRENDSFLAPSIAAPPPPSLGALGALAAPAAPPLSAAGAPAAMTVVGLVARKPKVVLEEIYLCSPGDCDVDLGPVVKGFYQPKDQILYLCLDLWTEEVMDPGAEDWEHLLKSGQLEVQKLEALLLFFSLCHVVLWFCTGSSPRLDTAALKLLAKVQEFQGWCGLESKAAAPQVIFVHGELKLAGGARQRAALEGLEKDLDNRWRTSLKRLKLLQDTRRSMSAKAGLFRVNRPCSVAMGREAERDPTQLVGGEEASTGVDRLRSRLSEAVKEAREKPSSAGPSAASAGPQGFHEWLPGATALQQQLQLQMSSAAQLPEELATALGQAAQTPRTRPSSAEMCWALGSWAFPELFFAFNSAQEAVEFGCQSFSSSMAASQTADPQELLRAALQLVRQKTYAPLGDYAVKLCQRHCERLALLGRQRPPCKSRGASGRPCALLEGHKESHRNNFRATRVCLCGKSQVQLPETFEAPKAAKDGLPPFGSCCHNVNFLPFLPESFDFDDPVFIPPSPRLAKISRGGCALAALPSALPEANGFVALVADAPQLVDPLEGARLPGFGGELRSMTRWRLPGSLPTPNSLDVYVGFEYVCPLGHRFFAPPPKYSGLESEARSRRERRRAAPGPSLEEGDLQSVPLCGYRLYVPCVQHRRHKGRGRGENPPCIAQLLRIWVQTPRRRELIEAEPRVLIVDTKGEVGVDGRPSEVILTGGKVVLPAGMLVQLVLPCAYFRASGDLPSFWDLGSEAERCRLLPYLLTLRSPS